MEDFTIADFQKSIQTLIDITKCAVCLDVVRPPLVQCVNGHAFCRECKNRVVESKSTATQVSDDDQSSVETEVEEGGETEVRERPDRSPTDSTRCPTCRQAFSSTELSVLVNRIVEAMPQRCRHKNCMKYVAADSDHERYCGYRATQCRLPRCCWAGPVSELLKHINTLHPVDLISSFSDYAVLTDHDSTKKSTYVTPIYFQNHFLWKTIVISPQEGIRTTFESVPEGKPNGELFAKMVFSGQDGESKIRMKLNLESNIDLKKENFIHVPEFMIPFITNKDKKVTYKMFIYDKRFNY